MWAWACRACRNWRVRKHNDEWEAFPKGWYYCTHSTYSTAQWLFGVWLAEKSCFRRPRRLWLALSALVLLCGVTTMNLWVVVLVLSAHTTQWITHQTFPHAAITPDKVPIMLLRWKDLTSWDARVDTCHDVDKCGDVRWPLTPTHPRAK